MFFSALAANAQIIISEIHYHPSAHLETDGDEFEFIELKNTGSSAVSLQGYAFTTGIYYSFLSDAFIDAGGFMVLAWNSDRFFQRYGFYPAGVFTGHLGNSGEKIVLMDTVNNTQVVSLSYSTIFPWPEAADGAGFSIVAVVSDGSGDPNDPSWWHIGEINGSPGEEKQIEELDQLHIKINEVLAHTDLPQKDAIELFNPHTLPVDIGGWYLTDNKKLPQKFRIPDGTIIQPQDYLVFDEDDFNADTLDPMSFSLSSHGEGAYIFSVNDNDSLTGLCHGFEYGESENGVSFGRIVISTGEEHFVAMEHLTLGYQNSSPLIGPLVITEINHNAPGNAVYIELKNISDSQLKLYDPDRPFNTWKISGLGFLFPQSISLKAGEVLLVKSDVTDAQTFRSMYSIPDSVKIFSFAGGLSVSGEAIGIRKPCDPYISGIDTIIPYLDIDQVKYGVVSPWPEPGAGMTLVKRDPYIYGNDPVNWTIGTVSPGTLSIRRISSHAVSSMRVRYDAKVSAIKYDLPQSGLVRVRVFDQSGRSLFVHQSWGKKGRNEIAAPLSNGGVYILEIRSGDNYVSKKHLVSR